MKINACLTCVSCYIFASLFSISLIGCSSNNQDMKSIRISNAIKKLTKTDANVYLVNKEVFINHHAYLPSTRAKDNVLSFYGKGKPDLIQEIGAIQILIENLDYVSVDVKTISEMELIRDSIVVPPSGELVIRINSKKEFQVIGTKKWELYKTEKKDTLFSSKNSH